VFTGTNKETERRPKIFTLVPAPANQNTNKVFSIEAVPAPHRKQPMVATEHFGGAPYFGSLASRRCFDFVFNVDSIMSKEFRLLDNAPSPAFGLSRALGAFFRARVNVNRKYQEKGKILFDGCVLRQWTNCHVQTTIVGFTRPKAWNVAFGESLLYVRNPVFTARADAVVAMHSHLKRD
jgi:hypothetical protein